MHLEFRFQPQILPLNSHIQRTPWKNHSTRLVNRNLNYNMFKIELLILLTPLLAGLLILPSSVNDGTST